MSKLFPVLVDPILEGLQEEENCFPIALRKAKIIYNFGLSECNRVKMVEK